jgi:hypothetical protein
LRNRSYRKISAFCAAQLLAVMVLCRPCIAQPSDYPCPIPSHVGISVAAISRLDPSSFELSLNVPRQATTFFGAYVFEIRDDSKKVIATIAANSMKLSTHTEEGPRLATASFESAEIFSSRLSVIETYPNASCSFANPTIGTVAAPN